MDTVGNGESSCLKRPELIGARMAKEPASKLPVALPCYHTRYQKGQQEMVDIQHFNQQEREASGDLVQRVHLFAAHIGMARNS